MIVGDLVMQVRSLILGSMGTEANIVQDDYDPVTSDGHLTFRYPKRNVAPGAVMSVGLNTFYILEVNTGGTDVVVLPSYDGGPHVAVPAGTVAYVKPRLTTWAGFREIQGEARSLSSPLNGLYWPKPFRTPVDWANGVYALPVGYEQALRLVRSRYKFSGETAWAVMGDAELQIERGVIRVNATPPGAIEVEFTLAFPFDIPSDLTTECDDLGLTGALPDILAMGAAATLVRSFEGRRVQPASQGDTRRSEEVQVYASSTLSRQWRLEQQNAINQEYARLVALYGWQMPLPSGGERAPWSTGSYQGSVL